jgi:hypothetical protein
MDQGLWFPLKINCFPRTQWLDSFVSRTSIYMYCKSIALLHPCMARQSWRLFLLLHLINLFIKLFSHDIPLGQSCRFGDTPAVSSRCSFAVTPTDGGEPELAHPGKLHAMLAGTVPRKACMRCCFSFSLLHHPADAIRERASCFRWILGSTCLWSSPETLNKFGVAPRSCHPEDICALTAADALVYTAEQRRQH